MGQPPSIIQHPHFYCGGPAGFPKGLQFSSSSCNRRRKFCKNGKWPRNGSPGHGFESRPLNWLSFFAENPFPATPGPETPRKNPKFSKNFQNSQVDYNCVKITRNKRGGEERQ